MRLLMIAILLACISIAPIVIVGVRNADGIYADNTYNKSLDYDKGKKMKSAIDWNEPECSGATCSLVLSMDSLPESVNIRVFRPTVNDELLVDQENGQLSFRNTGEGWYVFKLDYEKDGVLVSDEKSFYIKSSVI